MKYSTPAVLFFGYLLVQILYASWSSLPFISDSFTYLTFAQAALAEHTFYPNPSSIFSDWLVAPVYINFLVGLLKIGGPSLILVFNILLNSLQLILVYKIVEKLQDMRTAVVASVMYIVYLNNLGLILLNLTELAFGVFILLSIYLFLLTPRFLNGLLCGCAAGLAIGVRPTAWALLIAIAIIYVIQIYQRKAAHKKIAGIVLGVLCYVIPMGLLSMSNIHRFEFSSTTGPANLIMSANPKAKGVFDPDFFHTDSVYQTKKTYVERNEYLMERSTRYIQENPEKWLALIPRKVYSTFVSDGWAIPPLLYTHELDLNGYLKNKNSVREKLHSRSMLFQSAFWTLNVWQQLIYTFIFVLFVYQLILFTKSIFMKGKLVGYNELLINLFIMGSIALSILSSVGNPRYKYNFVILAIILISPIVVKIMDQVIYPKVRQMFGARNNLIKR